jgi:hypothetical protein
MHIGWADIICPFLLLAEAVCAQYAMAYTIHPERHSLRSWFVYTHKEPKDPKKRKEFYSFLMDILLASAFGVSNLPVIWKLVGWFGCFCVLLLVIQSAVERIHGLPAKTRLLGGSILCAGLICAAWFPAAAMLMEEKSKVLEGDLIGADEVFEDRNRRQIPPVSFGDSGTTVFQPPNSRPFWQPYGDGIFDVEMGRRGPLVSTTIRDAEGKTVMTIFKNHWKVFLPFCADKNFTDDGKALEILDSSLHVVFQLRFTDTVVQVQGEWWDNQGSGKRFFKSRTTGTGAIEYLGPTRKYNEDLIQPMFVYPISTHLGEFAAQPKQPLAP